MIALLAPYIGVALVLVVLAAVAAAGCTVVHRSLQVLEIQPCSQPDISEYALPILLLGIAVLTVVFGVQQVFGG